MKRTILSLSLFFFLTAGLLAQEQSDKSVGFESVNDAAKMADQIVKAVGLKANFKIAEAQVPNAMAVVHQGKRYILYNPRFITDLTSITGTKWAAVSVLAHEIGHHLYQNSVNKGKTPLSTELEADEFSGYVLQKMGSDLDGAEAAMKILGTKYATRTHPARADRLESIEEGWTKAGGVVTTRTSNEEEDSRSTATVSIPRTERTNADYEIAAAVFFTASPGSKYFITKRMNLIKLDDEEPVLIGKLSRSGDSDYPFIISDGSGYKIFVDAKGSIVNSRGRTVGRMVVRG